MAIKKILNSNLIYLYKILPKDFKKRLGKSKRLKQLRKRLLYHNNNFNVTAVNVNREYADYSINFKFYAAIKIASTAKYNGIENTVLRNSFILIKRYKPNQVNLNVIDIGANFGYLSAVWASSIAKEGNVIAFEPNKNIFDCIEKTIKANNFQDRFKAYNLAVGNKNKTIQLNVSQLSSNSESMESAINSYEVEMIKLDSVLENEKLDEVDIIKIDVDGIELEILNGAIQTLKTNSVIVIVETNDDYRIIEFFKQLDYIIFDMKLNEYVNGQPIPVNIFCTPKTFRDHVI